MLANLTRFLYWDFLTARQWFTHRTFSKLIVVNLFLALIGLITTGIAWFSHHFYTFLHSQGIYGWLIADYTLAAALVIIFFIGLLSVVFGSLQTVYLSPQLSSILPHPLVPFDLFFIKTLTGSFHALWPLAILFIPLGVSFTTTFPHPHSSFHFFIGVILLSLLLHSLGSLISLLIVPFLTHFKPLTTFSLLLLSLFLLKPAAESLFTARLPSLYLAPNLDNFQAQLFSEPIMSTLLPTTWIRLLITQGSLLAFTTTFSLILSLYSLLFLLAAKRYLPRLQLAQTPLHLTRPPTSPSTYPYFSSRFLQLINLDWQALIKNPHELNYAFFSLLLLGSLGFVSYHLPLAEASDQGWLPLAITTVWFGLYALIILIANRFIFPLMHKEYLSPHLVLSAPLSFNYLFAAKVFSSFTLTGLPLGFSLWLLYSRHLFLGPMPLSLTLFLLSSLSLILTQLAFGILHHPQTADVDQNLASTSPAGVTATAFSFIFATIGLIFGGLHLPHPLFPSSLILLIFLPLSLLLLARLRFPPATN